ncbi:MAG: c-type cytochrome [Planctomycetaceae bacterium]|nr:c-type cytochrome [Planctomycetaceae bacterium]
MNRLLFGCFLAASIVFAGSVIADEREPSVHVEQAGVKMSLVAEHPKLVTPTGLDVDEQGRVWLVASHTHFRPEDYVGPEHDEILVFTPDGKRSVFYASTDHTMDLELGQDGWVYLAERDRIFRVKDTDGDGQGDVEENLATLETEADYPHNGLSGLCWHPEGDLLFSLGENYSAAWTLTGSDGETVSGTGEGGIFRCRPDATGLRRIAWGLWNPFGMCVRKDGEIFAVDNDPGERPPCRLLHVVEGGDYGFQRDYGSEAHHPFVCWNGELRGTLPMIHPVGEAPCGVVPFRDGLLVPSWGEHRIDFLPLRTRGASYSSERIALVRGGRYFRPTCIAYDEHSSNESTAIWYLTDWVDGRYEVHGYGRLWRLKVTLDEAAWSQTRDDTTPTLESRLVDDLRPEGEPVSIRSLLESARHEDPFVSHAARMRLAKDTLSWSVDDIVKRDARDRLQALLAIKLTTNITSNGNSANDTVVQRWIPVFLNDPDHDVQFEALRWLTDERLIEHLPVVERLLSKRDLDFQLFEAAIAAWNTLSGDPEAGVRNTPMLLSRVRDADSSPRLRAYALRLLPPDWSDGDATNDSAASERTEASRGELLKQLLAVGDPILSLEAVGSVDGAASFAQELLTGVAENEAQPIAVRAEAVSRLAAVPNVPLDTLMSFAASESRPLREEALRAIRNQELEESSVERLNDIATTYPESADLIAAVVDPSSVSADRLPMTDTNAWQTRLNQVEGDADRDSGRRVFFHARVGACANCHRYNGRGNVVGPDLSSVHARGDRKWLLESILQPSREVAPEYRPITILLNDGRTFTGIRLQSYTREAIRDDHGQKHSFDRSDIELIRDLDHSFMPDGLVKTLTDRELRDLVAFLSEPLEK